MGVRNVHREILQGGRTNIGRNKRLVSVAMNVFQLTYVRSINQGDIAGELTPPVAKAFTKSKPIGARLCRVKMADGNTV